MPHIGLKRWVMIIAIVAAFLTLTGTYAQGGGIAYGQTTSGALKAGASDTWHFTGSTGDIIAIKVDRTSGDLEPVLALQDPTQQPVAATQAAKGQGSVTLMQVRLTQDGSYQITVSGNGQTAGEYHLSLTKTASQSVGTATPAVIGSANGGDITPGTSVHGELGDKLYNQSWRFRGNAGDVLDIRMVRQSGNLNPVLALISPLGDTIAASGSLKGGLEADIPGYQLPFVGVYTIIARRDGQNLGAGGTTSGVYELTISMRGATTASQNTLLIPNTPVQGRLNENAPVALYRMENGGALALSLDLGSLHRLARLRVLTPGGSVLSSQIGLSPLNMAARLPDKGPFLVEVTSLTYDNQAFADFALTVYRLSANIAKTPGDPQVLRYGEQRQSALTDADEWFFIGHAGDIISLGITPDTMAPTTSLRISGPGDTLMFQGNLGPEFEQGYTLTQNGVYEVEVRPADAAPPQPYQIDLERTGANFNSFGAIDLAADRGPLALGAPTNGALKAGGSDAWWFDAAAGQVINLMAQATSANSPLGLALKRPDGSTVDVQVTERVQGAVIQQALLDQAGRYRVVVFDSEGKIGGQYTLTYEDASGGQLQVGQSAKGFAVAANAYSTWALDVAAGSLINVRLDSLTTKAWSPVVAIADPNGQVIAMSNPQMAPSEALNLLGVAAPVSGSYHVVVGGQVTAAFSSYDLLANVQPPFGSQAGTPIQVSATMPLLPRLVTAPTSGPVQAQVAALINPMLGVDKQVLEQAPEIKPGNTVRGEIARGAFSQVWKFTSLQNQTVALMATSLARSSGPNLALLDSDGKIVHEQLHAADALTVLNYRVTRGGTYRIVIQMGLEGGRYLLSLNPLDVSPGPLQISAGKPLAYGQTEPGELPSDSAPDQYYFLGSAGDTVTARVTRSTGDLAPALHLLAPSGAEVAGDANAGSAATAAISHFTLSGAGMFTLVVQPAASGPKSAGRYSLYLGLDNPARPGNRGGGILTPGTSVTGLLVAPDNADTWLFQGRSGEQVTFVLTGVSDPLPTPLGLHLQDTAGTTFAALDAALTQGAVRLSDIVLPTDGIYRVQVTGGGVSAGVYSLTWTADEPLSAAGPLRYNQTVDGRFTANHNADSWVFSGTAGDVVSVALEYERGDPFTGGVQVRSENGLALTTVADTGTGAGARADNLLLPFSGSYTVVVANPDKGFKGAGVYSLSVELRDSKARSMGTVLRYGQQGVGDLYLDNPSNTWVFAARAGDVVKLSAHATDQFLKPSLTLKLPNGTLLATAQADNASQTGQVKLNDFKVPADGAYLATISGGSGNTSGSYVLNLDYAPPPLAENALLNYGDIKEGLIADDRPRQTFAFDGRQGDTVSAQVTREPGSQLAGVIAIRTAGGQLLARADANGTDSALIKDFKLPGSGRYLLVISRYLEEQGKTSGRFTVNLTGTPENRPIKETVTYGQQVLGRLEDQTPLERVNFAGKSGDVVSITSHATSGDLDTRLLIENAAGQVLASNDDGNGTNAAISALLLPANDTYTVTISRVATGTVGSVGNYEMFVNRIYQASTAPLPKALIGYGQRLVGSVDAATPEARYSFSGNQDDEISVQIDHQTDDAPPLLSLVDPSNTVLVQGKLAVGATTIDSYRLPVAGLYTISIKRPLDSRSAFSPYGLTLKLLTSPANLAGTAQSVSGGVIRLSDSVAGEFKGEQGAQYWLFEASAGQAISVNLLGLTAGLRPTAILIGPDGNGLATLATSTTVSGASSLNQFALPFDGVYSLLILPDTPGQVGQYRLTVQASGGAPATPLALGVDHPVSGTLDAAQPEQTWTLSGQAGQTITLRMLVTGGEMIPRLQLVSASGQIMAEGRVEQTDQGRLDSLLTATLLTAGNYTLIAGQVPANDGRLSGAGTYRLLLENGPLSAQAAAAEPLTLGQPVRKAIQQGSTDYWAFDGASGDAITVSLLVDSGQAPGLMVQDAAGHILANAGANTSPEQNVGAVILPAAGRYVVALPAPSTNTYTLIAQRRQNLLAAAPNSRPLIVGQPLDGAITADQPVNYWVVTAKAGDVIQIDETRLNGDLRPDLALFSQTSAYVNSAIADATNGASSLGPLRVAEDGKYLLVVTRWLGASAKTSGRYSLTLSTPSGAAIQGGGLIPAYDHPVVGALITDSTATTGDRWTFNGEAGEIISVRMTRTAGALIPAVKLIDATSGKDGAVIASAKANTEEALISRAILPATGSYVVAATRGDDKSTGQYKIVVARVETPLQISMVHAEGIGFDEDHTGELTKDAPTHAFVFFARAGERITVEVSARSSSLDPFVYLIGPSGVTLAADDNGGGGTSARISSLLLTADGFYGIVVTGSPIQKADVQYGGFTVSLTHDQPGAAYQGSIDVGAAASGALAPDQPVQEWTFQAGAGATIAATVTSPAVTFDAALSILSRDGKLLARSLSLDGSASVEAALPGPGAYTVLVSANARGAAGRYQLAVNYSLAPSGGGVLISGEAVRGAISDGDFTDAWRVSLNPGAALTVDLARQSGDLALDLALYGPDGAAIPVTVTPGDAIHIAALRLPAGGTYILMVSRAGGASGHTSGEYQLQLTAN